MGFMDAMKNSIKGSIVGNYGLVDGPDFPNCTLSSSDINAGQFFIGSTALNSGFQQYNFTKNDIECMKFVCNGNNWVRYWIKFKDGKVCFLTSGVKNPNGETSSEGNSSAFPIERLFGDIITF